MGRVKGMHPKRHKKKFKLYKFINNKWIFIDDFATYMDIAEYLGVNRHTVLRICNRENIYKYKDIKIIKIPLYYKPKIVENRFIEIKTE